jgi:hypothetical protein
VRRSPIATLLTKWVSWSVRALPIRGRLFISYGRRDANALAAQLHADLEAHGFQVWRDVTHIRAGGDWQFQVQDALRDADIVIALLSPHAVRRGSDIDSSDSLDSVCLDEISYARFTRPPKPIIPIMAVGCEAPLVINRLDYVDMTRWSNSVEEYQSGLLRLLQSIDEALQGRPLAFRPWHTQLPAFDFSAYLEEKRRDFTGRRWLLQQIEDWCRTAEHERGLVVAGDPGIGKSALVAEMVHRNLGGRVLAYHCCIADDERTLTAAGFVLGIAAMIASRIPQYASQLEQGEYKKELDEAEAQPGRALDSAVINPLRALPMPAVGVQLLVVDGLDESLRVSQTSGSIVEILASRLERLPSWLRVMATTRPDGRVLDQFGSSRMKIINAHSADNVADLEQYVSASLSRPPLQAHLQSRGGSGRSLFEEILAAADGNFLYARMALRAVELDQVDSSIELPRGLFGIYQSYFEQYFPDHLAWAAGARSILEVLVAAYEPLTFAILRWTSRLESEYQLPSILNGLTPLVPRSEGRYRIYHASLAEWLTRVDCPYRVSIVNGHKHLSEGFLRLLRSSAKGSEASLRETADGYLSWHGFSHLAMMRRVLPRNLNNGAVRSVLARNSRGPGYVTHLTASVPPFLRRYVEWLVADRYAEDVVALVWLLMRLAKECYQESGMPPRIVGEKPNYDRRVLYLALEASGWAGAVVRFARPVIATAPRRAVEGMMEELGVLRWVAGGFDIAMWAGTGFFEEAGGVLYEELSELTHDPL